MSPRNYQGELWHRDYLGNIKSLDGVIHGVNCASLLVPRAWLACSRMCGSWTSAQDTAIWLRSKSASFLLPAMHAWSFRNDGHQASRAFLALKAFMVRDCFK